MKGDVMEIATHPSANIYPLMEEAELNELAADIKAHGLIHPIVLLNGQVLDGRNRLRACEIAGVKPRTETWTENGHSPTEYVIAANETRRHLTDGQRAAAAVLALPLFKAEARARQGTRTDLATFAPIGAKVAPSTELAAKRFGASQTQVQRAHRLRKARPDLFEEVKKGKRNVWSATREAGLELPNKSNKPFEITTPRDASWAAAEKRRLVAGLSTMSGLCRGLERIDLGRVFAIATPAEIAEWAKQAGAAASVLSRMKANLKENHSRDQEQ